MPHVTVERGDDFTETRGVCGACVRALPGRCPLHPVESESPLGPKLKIAVGGETFFLPLTVALTVRHRGPA
jgi:hypothetical protein